MRILIHRDIVVLWASAKDTYNWAHRVGSSWPCSTLSGKRLCAIFDDNGLVDLTINGRDAGDINRTELSALCSDLIGTKLKRNHPAYDVVVGQFQES